MKSILVFCWAFFMSTFIFAQGVPTAILKSHYIFLAFKKGTVLLKSGAKQEVLLNYNSLTEEMIFEDNGTRLALAEPQSVDTVFIQNRKFIPGNKMFYEVITNTPVFLLARHICDVGTVANGANVGYGGTSQTAAANARSAVISMGQRYDLQLPDDYVITPTMEFVLRRYKTDFLIKNAKQVAKVFPEKSNDIKKFVKENNTNFAIQEDVLKLIQIL
ncbi:MAG: hypothetical protein V4714_05850 [Bacteroidota bacterium]